MRAVYLLGVALVLATAVSSQSNIRAGTDVLLSNLGGVASPSDGRSGTFPNGRQSFGVSTTACNVGAVNVPWLRDMNVDHPSIGMFVYREYQGRLEQISLFRGVKHGFTSTNSAGCGTCPGGAGTSLVIGCADTYGAGLNFSHTWLGPPDEIDPWTGVWGSRGSHFDRGFPEQPAPANNDDRRSPINFPTGHQGYRNEVFDTDLNVSGATFWVSAHYNVIGEPDLHRENNFATRQLGVTWTGATWSWSSPTSTQYRSPAIFRWTGASISSENNASGQDGRFYVAVEVTGPTSGLYHYEYAVFNRDNARQGSSLRIPICASASVQNPFFHDPDHDANNDWTMTRTGDELVFAAPAGNANDLSWGNLFNFAFDSDAGPAAGYVAVDQAQPGPGDPSVAISSSCPLDVRNVDLGPGCGVPTAPRLTADGPARIGNSAFTLELRDVAPGSSNLFVLSLRAATLSLGSCTLFVDPGFLITSESRNADTSGFATLSVPIPNDPSLDSAVLAVQVAELQPSGGAFGSLDLSNGLKVKLGTGNPGCR